MQHRSSSPHVPPAHRPGAYPNSPVLAEVWRGGYVESVHRGSWCLVDGSGDVLDGAGDWDAPFFARSAVKCLQVLPLIESGAVERYGLTDEQVALAVSSHNGEACHVRVARSLLAAAQLEEAALACGSQPPGDADARRQLADEGLSPGAVHNNCSGKHAGFLLLSQHLGEAPERYLQPDGKVQQLVLRAVSEMTDVAPGELGIAIDGCSAPTFRMPLRALGTAFARFATPGGLAPERRAAAERVVEAVRRHPVLLAGRKRRLCTALVEASGGTLFPKIGAEAVYAIGVPGRELALAVKIDDGGSRGLHAVVVALLERLGFLDGAAAASLGEYRGRVVRNWAGLDVGRIDVL